jgi:hypothetical protein
VIQTVRPTSSSLTSPDGETTLTGPPESAIAEPDRSAAPATTGPNVRRDCVMCCVSAEMSNVYPGPSGSVEGVCPSLLGVEPVGPVAGLEGVEPVGSLVPSCPVAP